MNTLYVDNILAEYERSSADAHHEGIAWYPKTHALAERMAGETNVTVAQAAAVLAVFSPRMRWSHNVIAAEQFLTDGPESGIKALSLSIANAVRVFDAPDPIAAIRGIKTSNFGRNIMLYDDDSVTVDVWAARIATGLGVKDAQKIIARPSGYREIAGAYVSAADKAGLLPYVMQAIVWCNRRGSHM